MITPDAIRRDFPSLENRTYLNTAAEGIPPRQVGEALQQYWQDKLNGMDGRDAHFAQEAQAKEVASRLIGLRPEDVAFCSCSSEAYNLLANALHLAPTDEAVISDLDFPAGATPWITARDAPTVHLWKSRDGALHLEDLAQLLGSRTRLVQVSLVSFYNGYRLPWRPFSDLVRQKAPNAVLAADITQALGRCVLDCGDADILISSTHKWVLGTHGGCVVGIPPRAAERLTTRAGGWHHLKDAFGARRFEKAEIQSGAASFATGMPSFAPIYALNASLRYLETIGIAQIVRHADSLMKLLHDGLGELGIRPMAAFNPDCCSGIVSFQHEKAEAIHRELREKQVHLMHNAGRLRASPHGYNTADDVHRFLGVLSQVLPSTSLR